MSDGNVFGSINTNIYYIYAPSFVEWSAGIRVLHYLCDELNKLGFEAYLALHGPMSGLEVSRELKTPILTKKLSRKHFLEDKNIVAIYPETIKGNPLRALIVIRWLLNYPSLLGGQVNFDSEIVLAYSDALAKDYGALTGCEPKVLYVPAIKSNEVVEVMKASVLRRNKLHVIYAQKFRALGGIPRSDHAGAVEITRFGEEAPDRAATLQLIREAEILDAYENTTVISEACLFGTPVICHRNSYFSELIASKELPLSGVSWDSDKIELPDVERNLLILQRAEIKSREDIQDIFKDLKVVKSVQSSRCVKLPRRGLLTRHSLSRGFQVLTQKGPIVFLRFLKNYMGR
jgi:hypothetical protein